MLFFMNLGATFICCLGRSICHPGEVSTLWPLHTSDTQCLGEAGHGTKGCPGRWPVQIPIGHRQMGTSTTVGTVGPRRREERSREWLMGVQTAWGPPELP